MKSAVLASVAATTLLAGCASSGTDSNIAYKSESPVATKRSLEIPPDLSTPNQQDRYPLPAMTTAGSPAPAGQPAAAVALDSNVAATAVVTADKKATAQIERAGTQRWVNIEGKTPAQVWPLLKAFWQDNGFVIQNEEPDIGLMETDWAENRAKLGNNPVRNLLENVGLGSILSTPERDRFRIRLEKSATGTDVFFTHRGMYETYINETNRGQGEKETRWQPRPADPELEAVFLSRFLVRLGMDEATAAAQLAGSKVKTASTTGSDSARIDGNGIVITDGFERSWRRVALALERQGLAIVDRDRSVGTYFVTPVQDEAAKANQQEGKDKSGFWSSLAFWKSAPTTEQKQADQLRVELKPSGPNQTRVSIRSSQGQAPTDKQLQAMQQKLLSELQ